MKEITPTIQIDSREQNPLKITAYPVEVCGLRSGDYGIKGFSDTSNPAFSVERKSLDDLTHSLGKGRKRFLAEVERLREYRFRALLIEASRDQIETGAYRSAISPVSLLATLDALQVRAGLHICWAGDRDRAARQLEGWVRQFCRGIEKDWRRLAA